MAKLLLVMGDQLSENLPSLQDAVIGEDIIVMGELSAEATSVRHHKQKIALIFSAMRHFAKACEAEGHTVYYLSLIHISEPTRRVVISYAVFCLKNISVIPLPHLPRC